MRHPIDHSITKARILSLTLGIHKYIGIAKTKF